MKTENLLDLLVANPPFGGGGFALRHDEALAPDSDVDREVEPALSGLDWVQAEFERLQALPFARSDAGSDTHPPVAAKDVILSARIRRRASHLAAAAGAHWPEQNRITITAAPDASRAEVSETLLHELVHAAAHAPISAASGRRLLHGFDFCRVLGG